MKKLIFLFVLFTVIYSISSIAQTLVGAYSFPYSNTYNYFWGITGKNDSLWIGSDYNGTGYPTSKMYKVTKTGVITDSLTTPFTFNHGLVWDGTGFWIAEDFRASGGRIFKIDLNGNRIDSIYTGTYAQGIGGMALDGNNLWIGVYSPDFATYPYAYAYKINLTTKSVVDTIPLRGKQVQGLAIKGDTIIYVTDNFQSDPERIYGFRKATGDTVFSFPVPDPDNDCDPHGLYWDGQYLYLIAFRIGNNISAYRVLYKYSLTGQGNPVISSPSLVDFGNVTIGTTGNQNFSITNSGTANLIISGKNITSPRFGIAPSSVPDTITPGQAKNYTLSFTPTVFDTTSGVLQIASNDAATPVKNVTLKGKGVFSGPFISVSTAGFNFNQRRQNSLCGYIFTVTNQGTSPLQISSLLFNSVRFRIDTVGLSLPVTIDTQRTKSFRVWFNPNTAVTFNDTLRINSNAVNAPLQKVWFAGTGTNTPSILGDFMWTANTPDNPYTGYDDYQPVSIKPISDVNGDGINDIIICSGNYLTSCWNGNSSVTGDLLWSFNTGYDNNNTGSVQWDDGMQIRDDVDGDGIQDVVFGCAGGNEMVYTISGRTGRQIWAYGDSITYSDGDIEDVRADKDFNGDGVKDVLVSANGTGTGSGGRHALICLNGLNGSVIFYVTQASDFTGDVVSTPSGGAIALSTPYSVVGFNNTGSQVWNYAGINSKAWSMKLIPSINADTTKEIIGSYGFAGNVFCVSSDNGSQLWNIALGSSNSGRIVVLDDLDSNGSPEFTLAGPQTVYRVDTKTHNNLWSFSPGASYIRGADFLSDVNGDGKRDVAVSMQTPGYVIVLNGATGVSMFQYSFGSTVSFRADRVCAMNSIDGNSTTEFVAGCRDGRLICFSGGQNIPIGINPISSEVPKSFVLEQNYPNPFNPSTTIKFSLPNQCDVTMKIHDVSGKEIISRLFTGMKPGTYQYRFDGSGLASGIYFYTLYGKGFNVTKRMTLIK